MCTEGCPSRVGDSPAAAPGSPAFALGPAQQDVVLEDTTTITHTSAEVYTPHADAYPGPSATTSEQDYDHALAPAPADAQRPAPADLPATTDASPPTQSAATAMQAGGPEAYPGTSLPLAVNQNMSEAPAPASSESYSAAPLAAPAQAAMTGRLTPGLKAQEELLHEAAAPGQHSAAGSLRAPASRYAHKEVARGYFEVWPAPASCEGYYHVRALPEAAHETLTLSQQGTPAIAR